MNRSSQNDDVLSMGGGEILKNDSCKAMTATQELFISCACRLLLEMYPTLLAGSQFMLATS